MGFQQGRCLVSRSQMELDGLSESSPLLRRRLVAALRNKRVAIVGDSLGRYSFTTLHSLLRRAGDEPADRVVIDTAFGSTYVQVQTKLGRIVDQLGFDGVNVTAAMMPKQPPKWAARGANGLLQRWPPELPGSELAWATRVDFHNLGSCWNRAERQHVQTLLGRGEYD